MENRYSAVVNHITGEQDWFPDKINHPPVIFCIPKCSFYILFYFISTESFFRKAIMSSKAKSCFFYAHPHGGRNHCQEQPCWWNNVASGRQWELNCKHEGPVLKSEHIQERKVEEPEWSCSIQTIRQCLQDRDKRMQENRYGSVSEVDGDQKIYDRTSKTSFKDHST